MNSNRFFWIFSMSTLTILSCLSIVVDDVQIYPDRYLPPVNAIYYDPAQGSIVIKGLGATLSTIAANVSPAYFAYSAWTTALVCKTDITLEYGAELIIETGPEMDCATPDKERSNITPMPIQNI